MTNLRVYLWPLMAMFIDEHGARELSEAITSAEKRPV